MKIKLTFNAIKKVALIVLSLILLYLCFSAAPLRPVIPFTLIPAYFAFVPGKRAIASMIKLLLIMTIWLGLMIAANGFEETSNNIRQVFGT